MDDWMEDLQKEEQKQKKIKALGETVRVSRIDPRNGWNSAPLLKSHRPCKAKDISMNR
jgi:hypothetical protein